MGGLFDRDSPVPVMILCVVLLAVAAGVSSLLRRRAGRAGAGAHDPAGYGPEAIGYLAGGRTFAADAVLTSLYAAGAFELVPGRRPMLRPARPLPAGATALERVAYAIAPAYRLASLRRELQRRPEMDDLAAGLAARGLLLRRGERARLRVAVTLAWLPLPLLVLAVLLGGGVGGARVTAPLVLVALFTPVMSVSSLPETSGAGQDVVRALRREGREHAATNGRARFGPGGAGMAVALYGAGATALVDPVLARYLRPPTRSSGGFSSGSGSSYYSCGGGSSCGGGGGGGCGSSGGAP